VLIKLNFQPKKEASLNGDPKIDDWENDATNWSEEKSNEQPTSFWLDPASNLG
jgi:hypothetical protein